MSATIEHAETIDNTIKADPVLILGFTSSFWDKTLIASLIVAAIAAAVVGFSTAASIIAHQQENIEAEASLERYKHFAAGKIAEARTEGIKAGRMAGQALVRASEAQRELDKYKSPRALSNEAASEISSALKQFAGKRVSVGGSPLTFESASLVDQLFSILKYSGIDADINHGAAAVQVGLANGVVARFVTGNELGEQIALAITGELKKHSIEAAAIGGMMEDIMQKMEEQYPRNSKEHSWVVIAVGDKK